MNASIISKANVRNNALEILSAQLPDIIAGVLDVHGGNVARVKPEQISLGFSPASPHDTGSDIRIMVYARRNDPRIVTENERAKTILEKVIASLAPSDDQYSIDVRLYLMEIGAAEHTLNS